MQTNMNWPTPPASEGSETLSLNNDGFLGKVWWNANIPREEWTEECPEFLKNQSKKNIQVLSTPDQDYPILAWEVVKDLIDTNRIGLFHRTPKELRRYIRYCHDLKQRHGSILRFMQHNRLRWHAINPSSSAPFENEADYKILCNDWPYAIDPRIVHLVVWTKFVLEDDPQTGELKAEYKKRVEDFLFKVFCDKSREDVVIDRDKLRWFKNWKSLRSVHALEHFHLMLYNPPVELIRRVTGGDRPMCEQFP